MVHICVYYICVSLTHVYFVDNDQVKTIGKCPFNQGWVGECFGNEALQKIKDEAVICSGSTLGSYSGVTHYISTMLESMDKVNPAEHGVIIHAVIISYFLVFDGYVGM